jgi:hypothetical protein
VALTSDSFFSSVIESGPGIPWVDPDKVLNSSTGQATSTSDTRTLELSTPLAGADIPPGQVITDIQMTVQWFRGAGNTIFGDLTITGGLKKTFSVSEPPSSGEVYPGDLAYWGVTAQEAEDFANGSGGSILALIMVEDSGPNTVACGWVKCQFTYEAAPPSGSLIFPPVI